MTTVTDLQKLKAEGERFAMLTAYDYPTARILDEAGIPVLLVGDSLANVVLGHDTTLPVTMDEMLHHTRAVVRGAPNALVVGDMPFLSYQASDEEAIRNAGRFLKEAGAQAVKLEGAPLSLVETMTARGIPVMGHLGLTPQSVHAMGGYRVQAREEEAAERLLADALGLEKAGTFAVVLEGVPARVARRVTEALTVPTIGIGAGPHCDGQVLVVHDLLGLTFGKPARFVKRYADLRGEITRAVTAYKDEVEKGAYPGPEHSYE
ncbi:MAG TPA: 3-methyl-2-oxobutanoate hydroxymethyltransferase [Actinomycetota bacterium]|nr:3-methyl-2-oxobutanoate hydroxymethyltransferase [Actinomycetota bacterium]